MNFLELFTFFQLGCLLHFEEGTAIFFQSQQVTLRVVRMSVFPTGIIDADELESQRAVNWAFI
jgi:hypothetical protein